jgi:hypothetical protein
MLNRFGFLVILAITLIGLTSATNSIYGIGSINDSGTKIGPTVHRDASSNQSTSNQYVPLPSFSGYWIDLHIIPNQEHPYIIVLNRSESQPSAVDGTFQVVSQPLQLYPNATITSDQYWFGIYGPYKSWLMNVTKKDFVKDVTYGLHYTLNLTRNDLLWSINGTELGILFNPKDARIGMTHLSFSIRSNNSVDSGYYAQAGWGKNLGVKTLPKEGDLSEVNLSDVNTPLPKTTCLNGICTLGLTQ